jgi:hypothetical protein
MAAAIETLYDVVNEAINLVFSEDKYDLDFFVYLSSQKISRNDIKKFIKSYLYTSLVDQVNELNLYLIDNALLKEAYEWMGEQRVIKTRDFLNKIIEDAKQYEKSKRPGRKPKTSNK